MLVRKGDVVLVALPWVTVDGKPQTKRRPAVVVSNDLNNGRLDDVLVVPLTCDTTKGHPGPSQVCVAMNSSEGQYAGLRLDSVVDCTVIATIPKTLLVSKIGSFSNETIFRIDECIRRRIEPDDDEGAGAAVPRKPQ